MSEKTFPWTGLEPEKRSIPPKNKPSWIPLTPIEQMAQTDYDVLIVGSGAGGGAALWRLCEKWGRNVMRIGMIEAGDLLFPTHAHNMPTLNDFRIAEIVGNPRNTEYIGKSLPDYPGARIFRALGGRTLQWYLMTPRLRPEYFRSWPISYEELLPYYLIAEQIMNVNPFYAQGSALQETLLDRLRGGGFPGATGIPLAVDLQATMYGEIHSSVFFSSIEFFAYALNIRPFDLAVNTRAVQILTERGKAVGVKVMTTEKKSYVIKAKTVILSASTFETPRLLLNSNIHGEAIGKYLVNHPTITGDAKIPRRQFPEVLGNASIMIPGSDGAKHIVFVLGPDPLEYYWYAYQEKQFMVELKLRLIGLGSIEARADNYISLDPSTKDEYGVPKLKVTFSYSHQDQTTIHEVFRTMQAAASRMQLQFYEQPRLLAPGYDNHEAGTCRMGRDPATSATNSFGQIHGITGLYVADNSVLPLTGPANPTLSTVALAIRTADYIAQSQLK